MNWLQMKQETNQSPMLKAYDKTGRDGFTLIEVMVVITIIGVISASVILRTGGMVQKSRQEYALNRIEATDRLLRDYSSRNSKLSSIRFELDKGDIYYSFQDSKKQKTSFQLGQGIQIFKYLSHSENVSSVSVTVQYSLQGTTPTFAIQVGSSEEKSSWLLFSGLTGQVTRLKDESDVEAVFSTIQ